MEISEDQNTATCRHYMPDLGRTCKRKHYVGGYCSVHHQDNVDRKQEEKAEKGKAIEKMFIENEKAPFGA
jgi:hypothetical protein